MGKRFVGLNYRDDETRVMMDIVHNTLREAGLSNAKRWEVILKLQKNRIFFKRNTEVKPVNLETLEVFRNEQEEAEAEPGQRAVR